MAFFRNLRITKTRDSNDRTLLDMLIFDVQQRSIDSSLFTFKTSVH